MNQDPDAAFAVVEAGDEAEFLSAVLEEDVLGLASDLFQCLDAVGGEARRDDGDPFHAVTRELPYGTVTVSVEKGGLEVPNADGTDAIVIANAAVLVYFDMP